MLHLKKNIDWVLFFLLIPILGAGLITMKAFDASSSHIFIKQLVWIGISLAVFFIFSFIDFRFLKRTDILVGIFLFFCGLLVLLFGLGHIAKGAQKWFSFGGFSFQPADMMKLVLVIVLSKYFSRRHVEIADFKHILISGLYTLVPFALVIIQPDFGSAMIIFFVWLGMILVSGISKKHLLIVFGIGALCFFMLWTFAFRTYQKERILTFVNPLTDIHGSGYNVNQSIIAVGSGQMLGKGVGFGTQSRFQFLPESQTDFIFAAFAEEWGFVGTLLLLILYGLVIWRILKIAMVGATNFEVLFGMGVAILFMSHIFINIGMNIGVLPVTGIPLPFMSYGGSHLLTEFMALGILMGMRQYSRAAHRDDLKHEFLGI